jgi:hypothetical protein
VAATNTKSRYGASFAKDDSSMRNGSMVILSSGENQGYDSRLKNYKPERSLTPPYTLAANVSLVSTISNTNPNVTVMHKAIMWDSEKHATLFLKAAAVLTCLESEPPADAFRPAYAGTEKRIFRAKDIRWNLLPQLEAPADQPVPSWDLFERYLQRPWLDHIDGWLLQNLGPSENQVNYGREFSRIYGIASAMLTLKVPQETKSKLTVELIQAGIDYYGLALAGRKWTADGGHRSGRKWPILFAGMMLDDAQLEAMAASENVLYSEDQQTYYGKSWCGQTALYQMVSHTGARLPYEEKQPSTWNPMDKRSEGYRKTNAMGWMSTALAVRLMNARELWGHDAFLDYCDRWMAMPDPYAAQRGEVARPKQEGSASDPFIEAMWRKHRASAPEGKASPKNLKWIWTDMKRGKGEWTENPRP